MWPFYCIYLVVYTWRSYVAFRSPFDKKDKQEQRQWGLYLVTLIDPTSSCQTCTAMWWRWAHLWWCPRWCHPSPPSPAGTPASSSVRQSSPPAEVWSPHQAETSRQIMPSAIWQQLWSAQQNPTMINRGERGCRTWMNKLKLWVLSLGISNGLQIDSTEQLNDAWTEKWTCIFV